MIKISLSPSSQPENKYHEKKEDMADTAHRLTDEKLEEMEKRPSRSWRRSKAAYIGGQL